MSVAETNVAQAESAKTLVRRMLDNIPDDVTLADIRYHVDVMVKIQEAHEGVARGESITHGDAKRRMQRWLID